MLHGTDTNLRRAAIDLDGGNCKTTGPIQWISAPEVRAP